MNTCPFCGEIKSNADWFKCGTSIYSPEYHRSDNCKDRQIANLTEKLKAWRESAQTVHPDSPLGKIVLDPKRCLFINQIGFDKLRDLGEI